MEPQLTIRAEHPQDHTAIFNVITAAFFEMPYADGDEAELVDALRSQNALSVCLVAEFDGVIVSQIAFSPAQTDDNDEGWYALGPVAVLPEHQRTGIGSKLVHAGLLAITALDAKGCILVGHPEYYTRFGFILSSSNAPIGQPSDFFMVKSLGSPIPSGPIAFHKAFNGATPSQMIVCPQQQSKQVS